MPFDVAANPLSIVQPLVQDEVAAAFEAAREPEASWAVANPERALAFLYVDPRPCAALDALLAA